MSGARGIYRDDCKSGDKLAREWTRIGGVSNLSVEYQTDIGKFAYTITSTGINNHQVWKWMAAPSMNCFEAYFLTKKNAQAPNTTRPDIMGMVFDAIDINNYSYLEGSDQFYFSRMYNSVLYYKYWNRSLTNDIWYAVRIRKNGKDVKYKDWQYGTAEPDWIYTNTSPAPTGTNENPIRFQPRGGSTFGISCWMWAVGDYAKIADIRITPIPRTGGP